MMATELQKQTPQPKTVQDLLAERRDEFEQALQGAIAVDYFFRASLTLYGSASQKLRDATFSSFGRALMQCAQLGLSPDPQLGEFYLIPRWNKHTGKTEVVSMIGYLGLLKRARRLPDVLNIDADVVREGDEFVFVKGTTVEVRHVPAMSDKSRKVLASYAVAHMQSGPPLVVLCDLKSIHDARSRSESAAKDSSPWNTDFAPMARKTALRKLCKLLPLDEQTRRYVQTEEQEERERPPEAIDVEASEPRQIGTPRRSAIFDQREPDDGRYDADDGPPPEDPPYMGGPDESEWHEIDPTAKDAP